MADTFVEEKKQDSFIPDPEPTGLGKNKPQGFLSSLLETTGIPQMVEAGKAQPQSKTLGESARQALREGNPMNLLRLGKNIAKESYEEIGKAGGALQHGDVGEAAKHYAGAVPLFGPMAVKLGEQVERGNYAGAAGTATGIFGQLFFPEALGAVARPAKFAAGRAYMSAMKPSTTVDSAARAKLFDTAVKEGIPVSASGLKKAGEKIDALQDAVNSKLQASTAAPIGKVDVGRRLRGTYQEFSKQVTPRADLKTIANQWREFLQSKPDFIPLLRAQEEKVGTYRILRKKGAYGEQGTAEVESQKALARGYKEELQDRIPELKALNANEGALLELESTLQRAVARIQNANIVPLRSLIAAAGGMAAGTFHGGLPEGIGAALTAYILDNPAVKSRLAIAVARGADVMRNASRTIPRVAAPAVAGAAREQQQ